MRKSNNLNFRLVCTSPNGTQLINLCNSNNLTLKNIVRDEKGVQFELNEKDYNSFKKIDTQRYTISIEQMGGIRVFLNKIVYRIGLIIGLIICSITMILMSNRLLQVHVVGLTSIEKNDVINELKSMGIGMFSNMNFDTAILESKLAEKFDFSLISIITKGNSLIINVKESLPDIEDTYVPIIADYNMVITSINVYSGTQKVKAGDIVYKGDTLVEPYIISGDSKVFVTPCAEIESSVYFSKSYTFLNTEEVMKKNGKRKCTNISISLGKWNIGDSSKGSSFENSETEEKSTLISKYFLPIKFKKTIEYELEKQIITRDFESEKDSIISNLKQSTYDMVPSNITIDEEDVSITPIDNGYIVNVSLMSNIRQVYSYHN